MHIISLFLILSSLLAVFPENPPSNLELSVTLQNGGTGLEALLSTSQNTGDCTFKLFGSNSQANLADTPSNSFLLASAVSSNLSLNYSAENLKTIKRAKGSRKRNVSVFFRGALSCAGDTSFSEITRSEVKLVRGSAQRNAKSWLKHLAKLIIQGNLALQDAFPSLSFSSPVDIQNPGDGTNRLFVVEQGGKIYAFENSSSTSSKSLFLDISSSASLSSEQGLLGLAFHPNYKTNGFFFINYTRAADGATVIERYKVSSGDINAADPPSALEILTVEQPFANHNGGQLAFGPDELLYIGLGDGGSGGDPLGHGQNRATLLGSMLRINIDKTGAGKNYSIPAGNPFVGNSSGFKEEIWAYGLRNPWRYSFDSSTGKLWAADVGQSAKEEVDIIEKGKNYGWNIMEGTNCYNPSTGCDKKGLTLPVADYGRSLGISVTGGYVYRGSALSSLKGKYLFGDFGSGRIWTLTKSGGAYNMVELFDTELNISTFGVDKDGELYLADYGAGRIYKMSNS